MEADSNGVQDTSLVCQNSRNLKSSSKKYIGVKKCESGRFSATITVPMTRKRRGLGTYDTAEEAAAVFDLAAKLMRGTKARTNSITFDPFKLTRSGAPTLSRSAAFSSPFSCKPSDLSSSLLNKPFDPPFLSKPSNPTNPFSTSLFNESSQKQYNHIFHLDSSSTLVSSALAKKQNISASGHPVSTNDFNLPLLTNTSNLSSSVFTKPFTSSFLSKHFNAFTLPCSIPYTQVPSPVMASTLNTISNTPSLSNLGFPSHYSFLPHEEDTQIIPTTQSLPNPVFSPVQRFLLHVAEPHTISSTPFLPIPEFSIPQSQQCSNTIYSGSTMNKNTSTLLDTISNTESLPNPVFPSIHMSLPCVDEIFSIPQSQQSTCTTIPCTSFHSTSGLFNQNEQQCNQQYGMEKELNNIQSPGLCEWSADSQLCSILQSQEYRAAIDDIIGLSNLDMEKGLDENQTEQQCIRQYEIEKLSCTQLADLCGLTTESNLYHIPQSQKCIATYSTISTTQPLPNPMFPSHHNFCDPHEEDLSSILQSQQGSISTQSTTGLSNLNMQRSLYENLKEQLFSKQYDIEKELSRTKLPGFECSVDSQLHSLSQSQQRDTAIHCTTGLSNLNMHKGVCENQNEKQGTKQDVLEKELQYEIELSSKESRDLEEWFTESMSPDADFMLENIPVTTFLSLDNICD